MSITNDLHTRPRNYRAHSGRVLASPRTGPWHQLGGLVIDRVWPSPSIFPRVAMIRNGLVGVGGGRGLDGEGRGALVP
jgi:hypothetical protein